MGTAVHPLPARIESLLDSDGGAGLSFRADGETAVLEQAGPSGYRIGFTIDDFLRAGGNPFDVARAIAGADLSPGEAVLDVTPSPQREARIAHRWTTGALSQWWLLLQRVDRLVAQGAWIEVTGDADAAASAMEVVYFATPLRIRPLLTFDLTGNGSRVALVRRVGAFSGETPWRIDAAARRVACSVPQDEVSAYESWVLMSMLDPGIDFIAQWRDAAAGIAAWLEEPGTQISEAANGAPVGLVKSVLDANEELWSDGPVGRWIAGIQAPWKDEVAELMRNQAEEKALRQKARTELLGQERRQATD